MKETTSQADTSRKILSAVMDASTSEVGVWTSVELAALLDHQLRTPLAMEAEALIPHAATPPEEARALLAEGPYRTFRDVIERGAADDAALRMVKEYAKAALTTEDVLPKPVARFLYVAAILRGTAVGRSDLSTLKAAAVERDARHLLTATWPSASARELLRDGLAR